MQIKGQDAVPGLEAVNKPIGKTTACIMSAEIPVIAEIF